MQAVYYDFATAQRRVDVLKRSGIWPGIRCHADGTYTLTFDPEVST
jgi:hypothetical protein